MTEFHERNSMLDVQIVKLNCTLAVHKSRKEAVASIVHAHLRQRSLDCPLASHDKPEPRLKQTNTCARYQST